MWHGEFRDPRLVEVYDAECPWSPADDFFQSVVDEAPARRVVDLGCGTGRLTLALAAAGHAVTGVDPAAATLEAARSKPGADRVEWIHGTVTALPAGAFDVALMTSHVAQFVLGDEEWSRTLTHLHRSLSPGGRLTFDTRDPQDRAWARWNPADSQRRIVLPAGGAVRAWTEVTETRDETVGFTHHYLFPGGEELTSQTTLRFRSEETVRRSLDEAGFAVDAIYGGWEREDVGHGDGELVVVASR